MKFLNRSTFGIIIGIINGVIALVIVLFLLMLIAYKTTSSDEEEESQGDKNNLPGEEYQRSVSISNYSLGVLLILLILFITSMSVSILLIFGITKRRLTLMRPWIWASIAWIIFDIGCHGYAVFKSRQKNLPTDNTSSKVSESVVILGIEILIFYPIYTLYREIRDGTNAQEQINLNNAAPNPPSYSGLENGN